MAINIIDAEKMLDKDLSKTQIDFLLAARDGVPFSEADRRTFEALSDRGLVEIVPFSHPRALNSIQGVVVSEDGAKVLNVVDNRHWASPETPLESPAAEAKTQTAKKAQDVEKGVERVADDKVAKRSADDRPFKEDGKTSTTKGLDN